MARARAWILNLDADDELGRPAATASRAMRARVAAIAQQVPGLLAPGDVLLAEDVPRGAAEGLLGRAWCPTPRAIAFLRDAGAIVPDAPAFEVLRRVNHRAFCADLGATLPGAQFVRSEADALRVIEGDPVSGSWLLKRAFGFAGRGHRRVRRGSLGPQEIAWIRASLRTGGGLQIEPLVERRGDFALHGFIGRRGAFVLGEPTRQACDERGVHRGSARAALDELLDIERDALTRAATETARACMEAGYFGPFGIDAFRWEDPGGVLRMNPRCELNARYTMGWAVGMGARRPDLDDEEESGGGLSP